MTAVLQMIVGAALVALVTQPPAISLTTDDGGVVHALEYGVGDRAVVLAHGGRFNKESWEPQAKALAAAGFRVLTFDFRGYGQSRGPGAADLYTAPLHFDVLAAVRHLRKTGARRVFVVGGSLGGGAAADAAIAAPGEIDRLVMLAAPINRNAERLTTPTLVIVARDDANAAGPRLPRIRAEYDKVPAPKELILLEGSAHAQVLFETDQGERVMREIVTFLSAP